MEGAWVRFRMRRRLAKKTGQAQAENGALAVSGALNVSGDLVFGQPLRVMRSGYLLEVTELAASRFEGREAELAAMEAFCAAPDGGAIGDGSGETYWRWLAPAWSGKTALMAQFALHPTENLDVLAFFILRRDAGRSDRTAFLTALQGQLREYLHDREIDCTGRGQFLSALERAAAQATDAGRRLVLLVDGLDEDTGVTSASSGYSIAALLPRKPPPGLRIIVAGRPNPPIPSDVLEDHPLHDPNINRVLARSPAAQASSKAAKRDLHTLLTSGGLGREVAFLIAAANGGLSARDLADLAGGEASAWDVEEVLGGSLGRSFQHRPAQWPALGEQSMKLFSFAHDELQKGALNVLDSAVDVYRARVHAFVDSWRATGWPAKTPEYALVGYPQLLRQASDTERLTALATDEVRHERLWWTTGTDVQALAEIADAFRHHRASPGTKLDLGACVQLAHRRDTILGHAANIPSDVIVTWAHLGQVRRAVALARMAPDHTTPQLLGAIVQAAGTHRNVATLAIAAARTITRHDERAEAIGFVADSLLRAGRLHEATALARIIDDPSDRVYVMAAAATAAAKNGHRREAIELAHEAANIACTSSGTKHTAAVVATAMALAGQAREAASLVRAIAAPDQQAEAMAEVAEAVAEAGRCQEATDLAQEAADLARAVPAPDQQAKVMADVALDIARAGRHQEAIDLAREAADLARAVANPDHYQAGAIALVARTVAQAGHRKEAIDLAREAANLVRTVANPDDGQIWSMTYVAGTIAEAGPHQEATDLARALPGPDHQARAMAHVAGVVAAAGCREEATDLAREAANLARAIPDPDQQALVMTIVAAHIARAGCHEEAIDLARAIAKPNLQDQAVADVAKIITQAGCHEEAIDLAQSITEPNHRAPAVAEIAVVIARAGCHQKAIDLAHTISHHHRQAEVLATIATGLVQAGQTRDAAELAHTVTDAKDRARVVAATALAVAQAGDHQEAADLAQKASGLARTHKLPNHDGDLLSIIAVAMVRAGEVQDAAGLARSIAEPWLRARAIADVAAAAAQADDHREATDLAHEASALVHGIAHPDHQAWAAADILAVMAQTGYLQEAVDLAQIITEPSSRKRALEEIATGMALAGHYREACELISTAFPKRWLWITAAIAEAMAHAGQFQEAAFVARAITEPYSRAWAMAAVAAVAARVGRHQQATELAQEALDRAHTLEQPNDWLVAPVAEVMAHTGQFHEAVGLAHTINSPEKRSQALATVAAAAARAGHYQEAADLAHSLVHADPDFDNREEVIAAVAKATAQIGKFEEAVDLARSINAPDQRTEALANVAKECSDSTEARVLLAEALDAGNWTIAIESLSMTAPEILRLLAHLATPSK
nr:hypothetical protein OG690_32985 [Streptomyces tubercidicus]